MPDNPTVEQQLEQLKADLAAATKKAEDAEARAIAAEDKLSAKLSAERKGEVTSYFKTLGREATDEAMAPYIQMSAENWELLKTDLAAAAKAQKPNLPDNLFTELAAGDPNADDTDSGNAGNNKVELNAGDIYKNRAKQVAQA